MDVTRVLCMNGGNGDNSYSNNSLLQVPEMTKTNKGNIYMSPTSPPSVIRAYREQFQTDFFTFLKCRAEEVVTEGRMVLTILGRRSDNPCSKECCYVWDLLATALNDMVVEDPPLPPAGADVVWLEWGVMPPMTAKFIHDVVDVLSYTFESLYKNIRCPLSKILMPS